MMKEYLVFASDLALAPLQGENPRGGLTEDFDDFQEARRFAESEKENWDRVFIFRRRSDGELERLEHFQKPVGGSGRAQRYIGKKRVRE